MSDIYISATHKSSGKTSVSIGLLSAFAEKGLSVQPFKKGPDYIDPLWLSLAAGRDCYNLDYNTQNEDELRETFTRRSRDASFALIEGNKGLYDGLDPKGSDCNAALAKFLKTPVILVLDTKGITRGLAPLVLGYKVFDQDVNIAGIILNQVATPRHESKLRASIEDNTDVPILGAFGRHDALVVNERHLGLTTPSETAASEAKIACLKKAALEGVDLDRIAEIAKRGPSTAQPSRPCERRARSDIRVGVARDSVFSFYYADDLEALERAGAELVFFDALTDQRLPNVDGLFLGGGFPETQMQALEANAGLRYQLRDAISDGLPTYAECGGMMYLCRSINWKKATREMVGAIPFDAVMHTKPQGRGLVRLEDTGKTPWPQNPNEQFRAHEFHYASLENGPADTVFAYRVLRGQGIDGSHDGIVIGNLLANFSHLRDTDQNRWATRFVEFVRDCKTDTASAPVHDARTSVKSGKRANAVPA